jgi:hypothetical protein
MKRILMELILLSTPGLLLGQVLPSPGGVQTVNTETGNSDRSIFLRSLFASYRAGQDDRIGDPHRDTYPLDSFGQACLTARVTKAEFIQHLGAGLGSGRVDPELTNSLARKLRGRYPMPDAISYQQLPGEGPFLIQFDTNGIAVYLTDHVRYWGRPLPSHLFILGYTNEWTLESVGWWTNVEATIYGRRD